ncbi:MAG: N-acetyltransferase family protein [Clostridiales bacterium]|nr:N-acetyltransferase family protein [Clostridiales bacterium]
MENNRVKFRTASPKDAKKLLAIYAPYVENTVISFEYEVPSLEEFEARVRGTLAKYPYLVAEEGGEILGYAYTSPFAKRAAYGWAVETSIYLRQDTRRHGVGRKLYQALEEISAAQNIQNMYARIGCPGVEDEYLTRDSVRFHEHMGYRMVGEFYKCGYKFGRWYHMVWMEKAIGSHPNNPAPVIPFPELDAEKWKEILEKANR